MLWCSKVHQCLKHLFCQRLWENLFVWKYMWNIALVLYIFTNALCVIDVECLHTLNQLPARNDPFLLFLLISSPKLFLTLADPVSTIQAVIYFPSSSLLCPLPKLTLTLNAADVYNFPFESRFLQENATNWSFPMVVHLGSLLPVAIHSCTGTAITTYGGVISLNKTLGLEEFLSAWQTTLSPWFFLGTFGV